MPIRLPDTPQLQHTPINAPQANPGVAALPGKALGETATAIAGVAEEFHQGALQVQKLENARQESEMRHGLAEDYAHLQIELQKDPEPASRIERTRAFFDENKGRLSDPNLPPAVQHSLGQHFDRFASSAMIRQGQESSKLAIQRATLALDTEFKAAIEARNPEGVQLAIQTALDSGAILPEHAEKMEQEAGKQFSFRDIRDQADESPLETWKAFQSGEVGKEHPHLDQESMDRLERYSEQKANEFRGDFANDIIISGASLSIDDIKKLEESGQMSKADAARWITKVRSNIGPAADPFTYEETYQDIMEFDPAIDPSGQGLAILRNRIASANLPKEHLKVLNDKLTDRINPTTSKTPKGKLETEFNTRLNSMFTRGEFGEYRFMEDHDNSRYTPEVMVVNNDKWNASWKKKQAFAEAWRQEMSRMPDDAGFKEVDQAFSALQESFKGTAPTPKINIVPSIPKMPFDPNFINQKAGGQTSQAAPKPAGKFGGLPIRSPGGEYKGAAATVFGGPNDPADNGESAFGGKTGKGGKEGAAIPRKLLDSKFPGKNKKWFSKNVRTVVRSGNGTAHVFPVVDLGTAEWVWQKNGRPTLDLTEGAARQAGGKPLYTKTGKLRGLEGLDNLDFAVVSIDVGGEDLSSLSWPEAQKAWFDVNTPRSNVEARNGITALSYEWHAAQAAQ